MDDVAQNTGDTTTASQGLDTSALSDIATNSKLISETLGNLINVVGGLSNIVLPVPSGGTGLDHSDPGGLLVGAAGNTYTILDDIATGNALISGGVNLPPSWGKIGLTTHVTGTLPVANGGTNKTSFTTYQLIAGGTTTTGALQQIGSGTAGDFLRSNGAGALPSFSTVTIGITDFISGFIPFPSNQDYKLVVNSPIAMTIGDTTTICVSGTCTATFKINTTALGGSANSVSSSEVTQSHTTSNVMAVGDDIVMTISSNSSCTNMSFTIAFTRAVF